MTKPPIRKTIQDDYVQVKVRLPPKVHAALHEAAERNAHSLNAEIVARLQTDAIDELRQEIAGLKMLIRETLDRL